MHSLPLPTLVTFPGRCGRGLFPLAAALYFLSSGSLPAASQEASSDVSPILIELLRSRDRDTRGLALQEVREGIPGEVATRQLSELVPTLDPEGQGALLDALGERGDSAGRPALLKGASSPLESVRVSAIRALGRLGQASDVKLLARKAASGSASEREAAHRSLVRLRGEKITGAIVALVSEEESAVRVELLKVLAARKAKEAASTVLRSARDPDPGVRLAALNALETLAQPEHAPALAGLLRSSAGELERGAAEAALAGLSRRAGGACLEAALEAWGGATARTRVSLLRCLAVIGGPKALNVVVEARKDRSAEVRDESLGIMASWLDPLVAPHLLEIARQTTDRADHAAALRGLVRLASADDKRPADIQALSAAWDLAKTADEQRLVLGALGGNAAPQALALAIKALDQADVAEEAGLAAVLIAERLSGTHPVECARAMEEVLQRPIEPSLRGRAEKVLGGLPPGSRASGAPIIPAR